MFATSFCKLFFQRENVGEKLFCLEGIWQTAGKHFLNSSVTVAERKLDTFNDPLSEKEAAIE